MAFLFNKRETLFDKRALGQSRRTGGDIIPPNRKLILISFIYIKKLFFKGLFFFFKKGTLNKASDPRTLYLSKIGPDY